MARKILLADDSVTAQNMGRKILADAGYEVVTVNNGSAALKRITELKPDLIVLDVYMPGYSGLEVCQRLKDTAQTAHIPVLLTVGKLEPFKPDEARRVRADAHIVKPFEASELLKAITRLEDHLLLHSDNGGTVSGIERFRSEQENTGKAPEDTGADTGWKSRLGFPTKKKKEEVEEAEDGGFREFRKGKGKAETKDATPFAGGRVEGQEIPTDITAQELDALSDLAAKLDRTISNKAASLKEESTREIKGGAEEAPAASDAELRPGADDFAARAQALAEESIREAQSKEAQGRDARVEEAKVEQTKSEATKVETTKSEIEAAAVEVVAAPVVAAEAVAEASESAVGSASVAGKSEATAVETVQRASEADAGAVVRSETATDQEIETPAAAVAETVNAAPAAGEAAAVYKRDEPMFAAAENAAEPMAEGAAPSDAELVQALRLLTPANWNGEAAAGDLQAVEAAEPVAALSVAASAGMAHGEMAGSGPRWMAEAVAVTPEEAALSLEAEMFSTFAAMPGSMQAMAMGVEMARPGGFSAITAAVESRLAAVELAESARLSSGAELSAGAPESGAHDRSGDASNGNGSITAGGEIAGATVSAEVMQKISEAVAAQGHPNADSEGRECMGKDEAVKVNTEKEQPAGASVADSGVVEAAKSEPGSEEAPKAMAAVAAAEGSASGAGPAADSGVIASIVESVLADLRPKLVEEIARKLSGK
ncbi:MAG: response regulator [Terriglobales bacterium]